MSDDAHDDFLDDIEIDVDFDNSEAIICCRILSGLVMADGDCDEREQDFLQNTMNQLGLTTPEEREAATQVMAPEAIEDAIAVLEPSVRQALLDALFQVALVDGHLANAEMRYINKLRKLMGLARR